jgi:hypothetical protein
MEGTPLFVPADFEPPRGLVASGFVLQPLGPRHNVADFDAWSSSMAHIHATPGFEGSDWPHEMSVEQNLGDLELHERDFAEGRGFTYTVLDPRDGGVIGCVYIYPVGAADADPNADAVPCDASVRSWVRADRAALDEPLWRAVSNWLRSEWPFANIRYAPRR